MKYKIPHTTSVLLKLKKKFNVKSHTYIFYESFFFQPTGTELIV